MTQIPDAVELLTAAELAYERLRVALESAKRGRRDARAQVAELERKVELERKACATNFWLYVSQKDRADAAREDAVKALTEAAELSPEHAEALCDRARTIAKAPTWPAKPPTLTVFRADWNTIPLGTYARSAAARKHCETHVKREIPGATLDWIEDEEDGVAELAAAFGEDERSTGYTVAAVEIASEYDEEADE
ncbi:hypothetical protein ACFV3N_16570 [Streptomyces bauhiniae]|uniref:hypothetical protein n=1 Tax=Streptomyces bauhiniae TaxID=2340725 RepID=UPI00365C240E